MKTISTIWVGFFSVMLFFSGCRKFSEINTDPNHINYDNAAPDYLMANVLIQTAMDYGNLGSGIMSGAMQHTYQDAFGNEYSFYAWDPKDWSANYARLRDNKLMLEKAQALGWKFHQGVGLIMRAFNFGMIADFWGDAPDSMALKGDKEGIGEPVPRFR